MKTTVFNKKSIARLSRYRRALIRFRDLGYERIVSNTLGNEVGVTASQVRKDFSYFNLSGNKKGGYQINDLLKQLHSILGKDRDHKVILAGLGNIGQALLNYRGFEREKINVVAGFDVKPAKVARKNGIPVLPLEEMHEFIQWHEIKLGIVAVPAQAAQSVCDAMVSAGIKGILNFAPIRLKVPEGTVITNVDVMTKMENIIYFVDGFGKNA